jgi:hypothetical protein
MAEIYHNFGENCYFHLQGKLEDGREGNDVKY